jgi:DNA mismatch repair protein MutS2
VHIGSLDLNGRVVAIHSDIAEIEARGKRIHVQLYELRVIDAPTRGERGGVTIDLGSDDSPPLELNVIGCRVDDAVARVEKYVDQALLHEQQELRIIHGRGTGQLRRAIAEFLGQHPLVAKFALAQPEHGGNGVTIIELKS